MKNYIFALCIGTLFIGCSSNDNEIELVTNSCDFINFRYYNNSQVDLGAMSDSYLIIGVETTYTDAAISSFVSNLAQFDPSYTHNIHGNSQSLYKEIPLKFNGSRNCNEISQIINNLEQHQIVSYAHFAMQTDDCNNLIWEPMGNVCQ